MSRRSTSSQTALAPKGVPAFGITPSGISPQCRWPDGSGPCRSPLGHERRHLQHSAVRRLPVCPVRDRGLVAVQYVAKGQRRKSTASQKINPRCMQPGRRPKISILLPYGYRPHPNSHIFIPGDMPFISFLLPEPGVAVGPSAPAPCTSSETVTLPAFSNSSVTGTLSSCFSGCFRSIIIRWQPPELDRLAGLDGEPVLNRTHLHDAALRRHFVDLDAARYIARSVDQPVRRAALVLDGEIAAAGLRPLRRGAAPGLADNEITGLDLVGTRGRSRDISGQGSAGDR